MAADKDLDKIVLDDDTMAEMAELWFDENPEAVDDAGIDTEDGWSGEPPEELDMLAEDAAADIVDQLRNPEEGGGGYIVMNPYEDVIDAIYFKLAEITAATPEDYEAWLDTLEEEEPEEGEPEEPFGADEAEDEVEGDEEVDYES
jgi:hypothetical protein